MNTKNKMAKKIPCILVAGLSSEEVQAALKSVATQHIQDGTINLARDPNKPNNIIVTAKQEIARFMVLDKILKDPNMSFIKAPSEKLAQDINEVIMDFNNKNADFLVPKIQDVFITEKKLNHKKKMERIIGNRYVRAQYNQLKKIMRDIRTRNK